MKKLWALILLFALSVPIVNAQDEEEKGGFKKENLFTGGSVTLAFYNRQTILGANPILGYKIADWVDAGIGVNYVYSSQRTVVDYGDKVRQHVYGGGPFVRLYPIPQFFIQSQLEQNWSSVTYHAPDDGVPPIRSKVDATSLLLGGGIASGREKGAVTFFYFSVMVDVLKDINSPYVNVEYPDNDITRQPRITMTPIIRGGMNIGLFQGRYRSR